MICSISEKQVRYTQEYTKTILKAMKTSSVDWSHEKTIKIMFKIAYSAKISIGESKTYADQYGLQVAEITIRQIIEEISKEEYKNIDDSLSGQVAGMFNEGLKIEIKELEAYLQTNEDGELENLKKLLKIRDENENLQIAPDNLTKEHSQVVESIKTQLHKAFPATFSIEQREYLYTIGNNKNRVLETVGINTTEGFRHFLRVTQIGREGSTSPFTGSIENTSTLRGTLFDDLIRLYFTKFRDKPFSDFISEVNKNKDILEQYKKILYSPTATIKKEEFDAFKNHLFSDLKYIIQKFKASYDGYYLVDMAEVAKDVYEDTLRVKGSLDFIAISPEGKIKIIDIKTTTTPSMAESRYKLQLSLYQLILKNAGFNVEDTVDLFVVHGDNYSADGSINLFRVVNAEAKSIVPLPENEIKEEVKKSFDTFVGEIVGRTKVVDNKPTTLQEKAAHNYFNAIDKNKKGLKQIISTKEKIVSPLTLTEDIKWLRSIFPELGENAIEVIDTFNSPIGGKFLKDAFIFALNANEGVVYHEAWHRFSQLFLTKKDKISLYEAVRSLDITFTDREDKTLHTKEISYLQAEEFLAEEFRKYVKDKDNYSFPGKKEVKNIFQKIWDFLQRLLKLKAADPNFTEIFKNLYTGKFSRSSFSYENIMFNELFSSLKSGENGKELMSSYDFSKLVGLIDNTLHRIAHENGSLLSDYFNTSEKLKNNLIPLLHGFASEKENVEIVFPDSLFKRLVLQGDTKYARDFVHKYLMETRIQSLRTQYKKALNLKDLIDEKITEIEGDNTVKDPDSEPTRSPETDDIDASVDDLIKEYSVYDQYNRSGHVNSFQLARNPVKEFFGGFKKANYRVFAEKNQIVLSEEDALSTYMFNKTREVLIGTFSISQQIELLKDDETLKVFPEALQVAEALEKVENTRRALEKEAKDNKAKELNLDLLLYESFSKTFEQLMGLDRIASINVFLDGVLPKNLSDFKANYGEMITVRSNLDNQLPVLFSQWNKNFQTTYREKGATEKFPNIVEAAVNGELFSNLNNPVYTDGSTFYLNYRYLSKAQKFQYPLYETENETILEFFAIFGIKIPITAFKDPIEKKKIVSAYSNFRNIFINDSPLTITFRDYSTALQKNPKYLANIRFYRELSQKPNKTEEDLDRLKKYQDQILKFIGPVYPHSPVRNILEHGLKNNKRANVSVGTFYPFMVELGNIMLKYSNKSSSGTVVLSTGKTKTRDMLPSVFSLTNTYLNRAKHIDDLLSVEFFKHLNPERNSVLKNSKIISSLFNSDGTRNTEYSIGRESVDNFSYRKANGEIVNKEIGQLTPSEYVLYDMMMTLTYGFGSMRRHEASNSQFRFLLLKNGQPVPPDLIRPKTPEGRYTSRGSILETDAVFDKVLQYMEFGKQFYFDSIRLGMLEKNKAANKEFAHFTSMLNDNIREKGDLGEKVAKLLREDKTVAEVLNENPKIKEQVKKKVVEYFSKEVKEAKKYIDELDPGMKEILENMFKHRRSNDNFHPQNLDSNDYSIPDYLFENYILLEHFNMMEDELLYFGNNSLYAFAPKRRKYSVNNGFVQYVSEDFTGFEEILYQTSMTAMVREIEGLEPLEKDPNHIYRVLLKDNPRFSPLVSKNKDGKYKLVTDLMDLYSQWGMNITEESILKDKRSVIDALEIDEAAGKKGKETSDSHSLISLDFYRSILINEHRWDYNEHEAWFRRQKLIYKKYILGEDSLTDTELKFIEDHKYKSAPPLKTAHTGPLMTEKALGHISIFDKMLQMPVIPEIYIGTDYEPLMKLMYEEGIDYFIHNSGTKGYEGEAFDYFSMPTKEGETFGTNIKNFDINKHLSIVHKMGHKFQLNTFNDKSVATLSLQLRSMFHKPLLEVKEALKNTELSKEMRQKLENERKILEGDYEKFLQILSDLTDYNATRIFKEMGLTLQGTVANAGVDIGGKIVNPSLFKKYLIDNIPTVDLSVLKPIVEQYSSVDDIEERITYSDNISVTNKSKMLSTIASLRKDDRYVDISGTVENPDKFMDFIKTRLNDSYTFEPTAIMQLEESFKLDNIEEFSLALQTSSLNKEIKDIVRGMIDDIRVLKLTGRKLYQIPEIGLMRGGTVSTKRRDIYKSETLKTFKLIRDKNDKIIGVSPAEAKVSFTEEHHAPLLELSYYSKKDKKYIPIKGKTFEESLRNLNNALKDEDFVKEHEDKLTFIGVRIPLQDTNFSGRFIVKEFLPPSIQNVIVLPVELYVLMGSDNDADTITTIYKKLSKNGSLVRSTNISYTEILRNIEELEYRLSKLEAKEVKVEQIRENTEMYDSIRQELVEKLTPFYKTDDLDLLEEDLTVLKTDDGYYFLKGKVTKGSVLYKKYLKNPEIEELVDSFESLLNGEEVLTEIKEIKQNEVSIEKDSIGKQIKRYKKLKYNYEFGKTNELLQVFEKFYSHPLIYGSLINTDSLENTQKAVEKIHGELDKKENVSVTVSFSSNIGNVSNNFHVRSMLGMYVKAAKFFMILSLTDANFSSKYKSTSKYNLNLASRQFLNDNVSDTVFDTHDLEELRTFLIKNQKRRVSMDTDKKLAELIDGYDGNTIEFKKFYSKTELKAAVAISDPVLNNTYDKFFDRFFFNPFDEGRMDEVGIKAATLALRDELGIPVTKNFSEIISSLLDLFKHADKFPRLNINWLNAKAHVMLTLQGVSLQKSYMYFNTPMFREFNDLHKTMSGRPSHKHVVYTFLKKYFPNNLISASVVDNSKNVEEGSNVKDFNMILIEGEANYKLKGFVGPVTQEMLRHKSHKESFENLERFYDSYQEFLDSDSYIYKTFDNYINYLHKSDNKDMLDYIETSAMQSYLLMEDSDALYRNYIKPMNQDSIKITSNLDLMEQNTIKYNRRLLSMIETPRGYENSLIKTPTGHYEKLAKSKRNLLNFVSGDLSFVDKELGESFDKMFIDLATNIIYLPDDKKSLFEDRLKSDFMEYLIKMFYVIPGKNTIGNFVIDSVTAGFSVKEREIDDISELSDIYDKRWFSNNLRATRRKYPELFEHSSFLDSLDDRIIRGVINEKSYSDNLGKFNSHVRLTVELPGRPDVNERKEIYDTYKHEIENILNLSNYTSFLTKLSPTRRDFYQKNMAEIGEFMETLHIFSVYKGISQAQGNFSHFFPESWNVNMVYSALNNFKAFLEQKGNKKEVLEKIIKDFKFKFMKLNPDYEFNNFTSEKYLDNSSGKPYNIAIDENLPVIVNDSEKDLARPAVDIATQIEKFVLEYNNIVEPVVNNFLVEENTENIKIREFNPEIVDLTTKTKPQLSDVFFDTETTSAAGVMWKTPILREKYAEKVFPITFAAKNRKTGEVIDTFLDYENESVLLEVLNSGLNVFNSSDGKLFDSSREMRTALGLTGEERIFLSPDTENETKKQVLEAWKKVPKITPTELLKKLEGLTENNAPLSGFYITFDTSAMKNYFSIHDTSLEGINYFNYIEASDVHALYRTNTGNKGHYLGQDTLKLQTLVTTFGVKKGTAAHSALSDVEDTIALAEIVEKGTSIENIRNRQSEYMRTQNLSALQAYTAALKEEIERRKNDPSC